VIGQVTKYKHKQTKNKSVLFHKSVRDSNSNLTNEPTLKMWENVFLTNIQ
jgi:hypothetical protein